jgi:hypothetical protein
MQDLVNYTIVVEMWSLIFAIHDQFVEKIYKVQLQANKSITLYISHVLSWP